MIVTGISKALVAAMSLLLGGLSIVELIGGVHPYSMVQPSFLVAALPSSATLTLLGVGMINIAGCGIGLFVVFGRGAPSLKRRLLFFLFILTTSSLLFCSAGASATPHTHTQNA
jgi:hypothetical protein